MPESFPSPPWEKIATVLYEFKEKKIVIVVDYYSSWFKVMELLNETSQVTSQGGFCHIWHCRCNNVQWLPVQHKALPAVCRSVPFHTCYKLAEISHKQTVKSKSRAVRIEKSILRKNDDVLSSHLINCSTPCRVVTGACQLLIGRCLQTQLPSHLTNLYSNVQVND